jgi:hypothetical protein
MAQELILKAIISTNTSIAQAIIVPCTSHDMVKEITGDAMTD